MKKQSRLLGFSLQRENDRAEHRKREFHAKYRQTVQDNNDRYARQKANDRADQERRDQERRHRETLSANQRAYYTHKKTPHYIKEAQCISLFFYSSFGWSGEPFDE